MKEENLKNARADLSTAFLEGVDAIEPVEIDLQILKDADRYSLEKIEDLQSSEEDVQHNFEFDEDLLAEDVFWKDLDVPLLDVVRRVFQSSNRPFILVRDDKIEYINPTAIKILELRDERQALKQNFLHFVDKNDWNALAGNIGAMLTDNKHLQVKLKTSSGKLMDTKLEAIYLPDKNHFSFVLMGNQYFGDVKDSVEKELFDRLTGLPSFYLFEDRVQMAVNYENFKDVRQKKNIIAAVGVYLDNIESFKANNLDDFILKKMASKLVLGLKKNYTVARGIKYHFWILLNDLNNEYDLDLAIKKIDALIKEPIQDNFAEYHMITSIGLSTFPNPARSAKKLVQQAIDAIALAKTLEKDKIVFSKGD